MSATLRDLRKLGRMLDEEMAALRRGDMERISQLGPRKLAIIEQFEGASGSIPQEAALLADGVVKAARRNEQMITAALAGLHDAQDLIARARLPRRHETYARDGMRQQIGSQPGQLEKRS